jgi:hypothetical protein
VDEAVQGSDGLETNGTLYFFIRTKSKVKVNARTNPGATPLNHSVRIRLGRLAGIRAGSAKRFEVRLKFPFGHRYVIEREEFLLAVSTDESAGVDPVKFVGEGILGRLTAMGACQHAHLSEFSAVSVILRNGAVPRFDDVPNYLPVKTLSVQY